MNGMSKTGLPRSSSESKFCGFFHKLFMSGYFFFQQTQKKGQERESESNKRKKNKNM